MLNTKVKDYHIQRELGRGGMAVVYLAHDNKFDTNVAVKLLNKEYVHNDNIRKRFLAEAKNMYRMSHPNIIKVTDLIDDGDTVAFVMEHIEGETLKDYLEHKGKLTDEEIRSLFTQMLDAVGYVHEQKLVHRDIKPSNFMITPNGKVKLMDFGIAKNTDTNSADYTQTGTGMQMGTPMYMSPEQITETKSVTDQSDIYSLGVVLWQMVTGKRPYDTKTLSSFQLQSKIVNESLEDTNTKWDTIIHKATAKEISLRYRSVTDFKKGMVGDSFKNSLENEATVIENDAKRQAPPAQNSKIKDLPLSISSSTVQAQNNNAGKAGKKNNQSRLLLYILGAAVVVFLVNHFISSGNLNDEGSTSKESPLSGELAIEWADIPGGTFTMGSPYNEAAREDDEKQHEVTLDGFKMSKYEVTFDQFDAFCDATGRKKPSDEGMGRGYNPVINVTWEDAKAFADWAGAKLPTEAQWEYACRAGNQSSFYTGSCLSSNEANYEGNYPYQGCTSGTFQQKSMPVSSYAPNSYGLHNMHGNVWEWCSDWYSDYSISAQTNPQGPSTGSSRVMRGGGWPDYAQDCRSAIRDNYATDYSGDDIGFRLVSLK